MTREEIISNLLYMKRSVKEDTIEDITINEAIEALEQEPCENVITRILKRMWNCRGKHTTSIDKVKIEQIIRDELSPVNPQLETGHWIE